MKKSHFSIFVCLLACGAAMAQPSVKRSGAGDTVPPVALVPDLEIREYYPARDPEARIGQPLFDDLELAVWGTTTDQEIWNLDLYEPITEETGLGADGYSRSHLPFHVDFSVINIWDKEGTTDRVGYWSGKIDYFGEYFCQGIYYESGGRATLIPLYSRVNQTQAAMTYNTIIESTGGVPIFNDIHLCAFDHIALFQISQNAINTGPCVRNHSNYVKSISISCFAVGVGSCWFTFGAGCIGSIICEGILIVNEYFWQQAYADEWNRTKECLCLETNWRTNNPGTPLPAPSCGTFSCPSFIPVSVPSLKP